MIGFVVDFCSLGSTNVGYQNRLELYRGRRTGVVFVEYCLLRCSFDLDLKDRDI